MIEQWPILVVALPPLALVLLLIILIAVWFTLVRPLGKWLHTVSRYTEEERRQYWLVVKANGRERFAWRFGVLRFGLPAFAFSTPLILVLSVEPSRYMPMGFVCLAMWTFGGYWLGRYVWQRLSEKSPYRNQSGVA
jgi:hypothetical protein